MQMKFARIVIRLISKTEIFRNMFSVDLFGLVLAEVGLKQTGP